MPEPVQVSSLDDLGGALITVPLRHPDGRALLIQMRELAEGEVWAIRRSNQWPKPPMVEMSKSGPVYDYSDAGYQASVEDTNRRFAQKMLLACLPFDVPGETEDDKLAAIQTKVGQYVYQQLIEAAQRINMITPEEIAAVADSFRSLAAGRAPGDGSAGAGTEPVASPASG